MTNSLIQPRVHPKNLSSRICCKPKGNLCFCQIFFPNWTFLYNRHFRKSTATKFVPHLVSFACPIQYFRKTSDIETRRRVQQTLLLLTFEIGLYQAVWEFSQKLSPLIKRERGYFVLPVNNPAKRPLKQAVLARNETCNYIFIGSILTVNMAFVSNFRQTYLGKPLSFPYVSSC